MNVPDKAIQATRDAEMAWNRLLPRANANKANWSDEQRRDLALFATVIQDVYNALKWVIDANRE